jgi:hypothetical protein
MDGVAFKFKLEGALGGYIPNHSMQIPGQTRLAAPRRIRIICILGVSLFLAP